MIRIPEYQQDAATALSGSGPAYVFYLVEAMVDAGILLGMPRRTALEMVTQTVYGAATMLRDSGEHPVILRDAVTSPAGTTIAAIRELEKHGVRAAFLAAIEAARDRGRELGGRVTGSAAVVWDDALTSYDFGPGHPFDPVTDPAHDGARRRARGAVVPRGERGRAVARHRRRDRDGA